MTINPITAHKSLLSLAKPNGMKPIKPPTAILVSLFCVFVNAPIKTSTKPITMTKIPMDVKLMGILVAHFHNYLIFAIVEGFNVPNIYFTVFPFKESACVVLKALHNNLFWALATTIFKNPISLVMKK